MLITMANTDKQHLLGKARKRILRPLSYHKNLNKLLLMSKFAFLCRITPDIKLTQV